MALLGSAAPPISSPFGDSETPSIGFRAPQFPLAVLDATRAARFDNQAKPARWTLTKLERSGCSSSVQRARPLPGRPIAGQGAPILPRRFLPARHLTPHAPNDSGDPFPASSLPF